MVIIPILECLWAIEFLVEVWLVNMREFHPMER